MNSVERVKHYSSLANEQYEGTLPPAGWPQQGFVSFQDVSLRYTKDLQVVVDGINVAFQPGEKVGRLKGVYLYGAKKNPNWTPRMVQCLFQI